MQRKQASSKVGRVVEVVMPRPKSRRDPGARMSVLLSNPDYLLEGFAEKKCTYLGQLEEVPMSADLSNRSFLLAELDEQRGVGKLPWKLGPEHSVTVTLSAYNIKIIQEDRTGTVLQRLPLHEVASISYINDDDQHLLFLRAGQPGGACCPVHVLCCSKRADAEEMCSILQQAFQLVYTEATMEHLNDSISAGERGGASLFTPPPLPASSPHRTAAAGGGTLEGDGSALVAGGDGGFLDNSGESLSAEELVQRYMERLHKLLDFQELREFATLLKHYRDNLPVGEFLSKLASLYGEQRYFLIPDMCSFIPEEDRQAFEDFLSKHNLQSNRSRDSKPRPPAQTGGESPSKTRSGDPKAKPSPRKQKRDNARVADVDKILQDIDSTMDSVLETTNF